MFPVHLKSEGNAWANAGTREIKRNSAIGRSTFVTTTTKHLPVVRMFLWTIPGNYDGDKRHNMKKLGIHPIGILLVVFALAGAVVAHAADLEIAPLFAGYERGCGTMNTAAEGLVVWANPDGNGRLASADILPAVWRGHVGNPVVTDMSDHWHVKVPLRNVLFSGLRVIRLERWYGKGCGISGWSLVLAAPLAEARRRIDETRFKPGEGEFLEDFKPALIVDQDGRYTQLVCDVSM